MSKSTLVNLATVGSDELQAMPVAVFTAGLEQMSAEAIVRFRRMRKLSAPHRSALEKYLVENPSKRPGGAAGADSTGGRGGKGGAEEEKEAQKKKRGGEAGFGMELLLRVIAWWEGMDTDDVARAKGIKRRKRKKPAPAPQQKVSPAAAARPAPEEETPPLGRVELIQKLWGEGFSLPGGASFALRVAAPITLSSSGRYLDLTPGLGGGMRAIAKASGATILGIEADGELAAAAQLLSEQAGMGTVAPVRAVGPDGLGPEDFEPAGGYAAIFMREAMFAVEDKERMLDELQRALSDEGSLVLTDFVLADGIGIETEEDETISAWRAAEGHVAHPWTQAEYRAALGASGYKLERMSDLTSVYLPLIQTGWRQLHDCLQNAKLPPESATTLMHEGSVWLARSRALEPGPLRLVHIHAVRAPLPNGDEHTIDEAELADG
ncbi:hypothetical protein Plav_1116 [Parvibaculum lavamentivorans DS-1]|uniref:Methyltransferase type 11 n=1 Tax=Parvibaculum lavamentivorans (strain DS-1 / DSM 13023 / NCIMB 13966) TaxID=402881 RepID=A7HS54_PARL1|nr:methyltransferase domain-containing protein [Parvibaculum lavamentivorans]ABS62737.1 hypothetical protein Plav_1116 [Parvibaculum lavamentivorans DS-1]